MIWAVPYAIVLFAVGVCSFKWGKETEQFAISVMGIVWLATLAINFAVGIPSAYAPYLYAVIDVLAILAFLRFSLSYNGDNWLWILSALHTAMLFTHLVYWWGTNAGFVALASRPYQDFLAILSYAALLTIGGMALRKGRGGIGSGNPFVRWAFSDSLRFSRRVGHSKDL